MKIICVLLVCDVKVCLAFARWIFICSKCMSRKGSELYRIIKAIHSCDCCAVWKSDAWKHTFKK